MAVDRWGEFGEVAVRMMGQVKPGENLLIVADTWTDMEIAEACLIAGINAKANAQLLVIPRRPDADTSEFNPSTAGAIQGADLIVALCKGIVHKEATRKARDKGTRIVSTMPRGIENYVIEGILDVDYKLMIQVCEKICELWEETEVCRVTSSLGTDISFQVKGRPALVGDGMATEPGEADYFPGVDASIAPVEETINGTIVVDGAVSTRGLVSAPVACRLEKGIITAIEGGADATAAKGEKVTPEYAKAHREGFQKALKTGVKIACGGDSNPAGQFALLEIEHLARAGMGEMEALIAATRTCANLCGVADRLGTVEVGKLADLIVLSGDPLENISNIRNLSMALKGGQLVGTEELEGLTDLWELLFL